MKWLAKFLFPKIKKKEPNTYVDDLIWEQRIKLPTYDYANRHFETEWMLKIRQEDLNKHQIMSIINETPEKELLTSNYNNETLLSLLIEKDESYQPVIKALIEKYPQAYDQLFKVKSLKSYIEYTLEKQNLTAYRYLLSRENSLKLNESQYENYLQQLLRFTKGNDNILVEGLDKVENLKEIPWNTLEYPGIL